MINQNIETLKLAQIQRELLTPTQAQEQDTDIIIKIRNGIIVWAEATNVHKQRVIFDTFIIE